MAAEGATFLGIGVRVARDAKRVPRICAPLNHTYRLIGYTKALTYSACTRCGARMIEGIRREGTDLHPVEDEPDNKEK